MAGSDLVMPASNAVLTRLVVGAALIALALFAVWQGSLMFTALVAAATLLMFAEWCVMHGIARGFRLAGLALLAGICWLATNGPATQAVIAVAAGAGLLGLFARGVARPRAFWLASGILYCGLPAVALLWLRGLPKGLELTIAVLLLVWATDICAYFIGRAVGGPKFAPAVSPNKTWAGVAGGVTGAVVVSAIWVKLQPGYITAMPVLLTVAAGMAVIAVLGDLFESWLKRRAGVKDSGTLLPGHGGVLDRLDGLVPVAVVFAGLVLLNGGGR